MPRVLVIDDDAPLRADITYQLQSWGYEIAEAADGRAGLAAVRDWSPDVVLSDIDMPDMSGYDLIVAVAEEGLAQASIGFFFISSLASRQNVLSGYGVGADEYLVKPIDYQMLRARLSSYLRKRDIITEKEADDAAFAWAKHGAIGAVAFTTVGTVTGIVGFLILYLVKSGLGYDLMPDTHLLDLVLGRS